MTTTSPDRLGASMWSPQAQMASVADDRLVIVAGHGAEIETDEIPRRRYTRAQAGRLGQAPAAAVSCHAAMASASGLPAGATPSFNPSSPTSAASPVVPLPSHTVTVASRCAGAGSWVSRRPRAGIPSGVVGNRRDCPSAPQPLSAGPQHRCRTRAPWEVTAARPASVEAHKSAAAKPKRTSIRLPFVA